MKKVEKAFDNTIEKIDKVMHLGDQALGAFLRTLNALLDEGHKKVNYSFELFNQVYKKNARFLRHISLPWGVLIPITYKLLKFNELERIPLLKEGMHQVRASVGGGKSLTSLVLAELTLKHTGLPSYFTSPVEKPQLSEDGRYYYVMHRVIDLNDYYKDGKKTKNFNAKIRPYIHKDERHLDFNPRMNKSKEYNKRWIPEHQDELLMRHDSFKCIIKYSQHMKLDWQEMETLTYMHEVETVKDIPIKRWIDDGLFKYIPVKLKFQTYKINFEFDGTMKRKLIKKWKLPVPYEVLLKFDTHAERHKHAGIPFDYER